MDADNRGFRNRLLKDLNENYFKVKTAIEKIKLIVSGTGRWGHIEKVLDRANEDERTISLGAVLEASLDELLAWVYTVGSMSLKMLEDVLLL